LRAKQICRRRWLHRKFGLWRSASPISPSTIYLLLWMELDINAFSSLDGLRLGDIPSLTDETFVLGGRLGIFLLSSLWTSSSTTTWSFLSEQGRWHPTME
jgi:hypothetical protein